MTSGWARGLGARFQAAGLYQLLTMAGVAGLVFVLAGSWAGARTRAAERMTAIGRAREAGSEVLDSLAERWARVRRAYARGAPDWTSRLDLGQAPAPAPGSRLPKAARSRGGGLAEGGNALLLLTSEEPLAGPDRRLEVLRFRYWYVSAEPSGQGGEARRHLVEWTSAPYLDYRDLPGSAGEYRRAAAEARRRGVHWAVDPRAEDPGRAFHRLEESRAAPDPAHRVPLEGLLRLTMAGGRAVFVSPNTRPRSGVRHAVPRLIRADGEFPSGFEVLMSPSGGVTVRLVLLGAGPLRPRPAVQATRTFEPSGV